MMARFWSAILVSSLSLACQNSAASSGSQPPATAQAVPSPSPAPAANPPPDTSSPGSAKPVALTVAAARSLPAGTAVEVVGLYLGWSGPCSGEPPTRSAWQVADEAQPGAPCLYVDGPMVPGVAPNAPPAGLKVRVRGTIRGQGAELNLQAQEVTRE